MSCCLTDCIRTLPLRERPLFASADKMPAEMESLAGAGRSTCGLLDSKQSVRCLSGQKTADRTRNLARFPPPTEAFFVESHEFQQRCRTSGGRIPKPEMLDCVESTQSNISEFWQKVLKKRLRLCFDQSNRAFFSAFHLNCLGKIFDLSWFLVDIMSALAYNTDESDTMQHFMR